MAAIAPASSAAFLDLVSKSGILTPDQIRGLPDADSLPPEPTRAATVLVQKGILTRFQAAQMLAGRHKGFRIGPYVIHNLLGRGGMGAVYLAQHLDLHRKVAIKVLTPGKGDDQKLALERFLREARAAAALDHPNIVRIHDVARHNEVPYLVMEYVEGETLQQAIDRNGRMSFAVAAECIAQAASGLQHAHEKGFVHRDIKPGNLIRDNAGVVKILDMGLARSGNDKDKLTEQFDEGAVVGTADFISPEQAIDSPNVDARADIYSLGATFYTLLLGKPPFGGNTTQKLMQHQLKEPPALREVDSTIPAELSDVVSKMLAKKPADRYQTPADVIVALAPWSENSTRVLAGISQTNLGAGDSQAALQVRTIGSSRRLLSKPTSDSSVDPSDVEKATGVIAGAETVRDHPSTGPLPVVPPPTTQLDRKRLYLIIGLAAALVVVVAFGLWLAFSGDKTPDNTKIETQEPTPTPTPQPQPNPPKIVPPKVEPPRDEAVYRIDPATIAPFQVRLKGGTVLEGKRGTLPPGVSVYALNNDVEARFAAAPVDGVMALGLTRLAGAGSAQLACELEKDTVANGVGMKLTPGTYRLRIEYRALAGTQMGVGIHTFNFKPVAEYKVVSSPADRWETAEVTFERGTDPIRFVIECRSTGATRAIHLRAISLFRVTTPTPLAEHTRVLSDFTMTQPFVVRSGLTVDPNDANKMTYHLISKAGPGAMPSGWVARCWNKDTEMEVFSETFAGVLVLGIRNTRGPGSAMLFTSPFNCPSGLCRLRIEYAANVRDKGLTIRFKPDDQRGAWDVAKPAVGGDTWRTEELLVDLKGANGGFFEFHNNDSGANNAIRFRSVSVVEPSPVSQDRELYKLDATDLPGFRNAKLGRNKTSGENDPKLNGIYFGGWKADTESEWVCGPVGNVKAIGLTNLNDVVSAQIGMELENSTGLNLKFEPGQMVRLRVTYRTAGKGRGSIYFQHADDYKVTDRVDLPNSNSEWKTVDLVTQRNMNPLRCLIDTSEKGAGNALYIRSATVLAIGEPRSVAVAPTTPDPTPAPKLEPALDPNTWAEGTSIYTLDVAKIPAFRTQKEKFTRTGGDMEQLPAGVSCQCWKDGAVGDFRRATFDSVPALGLTNLNDEKSSQFVFSLEDGLKLKLEPGKAYRVKVGYRTANDAVGGVVVHVAPGYQSIGSAPMPASGNQWKTASASFTRPSAEDKVEVRMVIDNDAVGEGNTLWIRSVEVVELTPPKK